jgi:hypothetical protein
MGRGNREKKERKRTKKQRDILRRKIETNREERTKKIT